MDIVSPVMTFDIGALAPTNPYERALLSAAIEDSTDYVADILDPQFTHFLNAIKKLEKYKLSHGSNLTIDDCLSVLAEIFNYEYPLEVFNKSEDEDAYIFFDKVYYCIINKDGLDYPSKYEKYMRDHISSMKKVHNTVKEKYGKENIDNHILIFTNFFITLRNKPFVCWTLNTDKYGNVFLDE